MSRARRRKRSASRAGKVAQYLELERKHPYPNDEQRTAMVALWATMTEAERAAAERIFIDTFPRRLVDEARGGCLFSREKGGH